MKKWGVKVPSPAGKGIYWFNTKHSANEFAVRWYDMAPKGTPPALVFHVSHLRWVDAPALKS